MKNRVDFTKGNWRVMPGDRQPRICVEGDMGWPIVIVVSGHSEEGTIANEHLISAAPDLYEACARVFKATKGISVCDLPSDLGMAMNYVLIAMRKAEGK